MTAAAPPEILIVEDDAAIRRLVEMVLRRQGHAVETASDGVEAVLKLGVHEYDVIILDLMMPNLDGFAFVETLAVNAPELVSKIIVMSAASPPVIRERLKGRPFEILTKPFDINQLVAAVNACLRKGEA